MPRCRFLIFVCLVTVGLVTAPPTPAEAQAAAPSEVRELSLRVGEQTSLSGAGVKSYSAGVPGVVEVRLSRDGEQFVLVALKPGVTTLLLFMLDGREVHYRIEVEDDRPPEPEGIVVEARDNIRLDMYFVQVSEDYGHQLGVAYPQSVGGSASVALNFDLMSATLTEASLGIADQVLPRLDLAQRGGWVRVARQAAVVAENGKQAEFQSGGEVNVRIQGALTAEIRVISFGSKVRIAPRFDQASGRIELKVGAEVADLTSDGGTGLPGRQLAKLDTVVNLDLGKSLVLGGLNSERELRSNSGLPGLSRIPILGGLFGSRSRLREETKNLLFIVPSVVQAVPLRERNLVEEMLRVYERFDGDVSAVSLLDRGAGR